MFVSVFGCVIADSYQAPMILNWHSMMKFSIISVPFGLQGLYILLSYLVIMGVQFQLNTTVYVLELCMAEWNRKWLNTDIEVVDIVEKV